jgi:hypothetical protein
VPLPEPSRHRLPSSSTGPSPPSVSIGAAPGKAAPAGAGVPTYAVIAFLAVTVLPATALAQPHWHRGEETQVTVYVERTRVGATNWSYVKRAGPRPAGRP